MLPGEKFTIIVPETQKPGILRKIIIIIINMTTVGRCHVAKGWDKAVKGNGRAHN